MAIESLNAASAASVANSSVQRTSASETQSSSINTQALQQAQAIERADKAEAEERAQEAKELSPEQLKAAINRLNELMENSGRSLAFSVDDELGDVVVKVMDKQTEELIRQIPNEEALKFAKNLEGVLGVIFNDIA